ncbi:MAG: selenocysteine-specific translation factor [Deltaproteobacteria bacterium]|nr:MAG: selenocysteine-specific translation factor [Deltaproteobacteria bacterium]
MDVPGHERFVKNMLAGVGGVDLVLLVIAADEGVMPQTREHFSIVKLLGVERGVIVLTKRDLVDDDWLALVTRDVRALVADTFLADAPIVPFSAVTGAGAPELLAAMDGQLAQLAEHHVADAMRLPIDRVFTVEGFGTVVTGTLWRGRVSTGDVLELLPLAAEVRVRRVQVHGATVDEALAGQRTALALHGVAKEQVSRGDWLVAPGSLRPSRVLDVRFELLADYPREWKPDTRVRFHLGASEIIGRLFLLGASSGSSLAPGESALAQVRLERPAVAARGDRFVVRSYSPSRTVGGGSVIEPVAERRRRSDVAGLDALEVHESGSLESRLLEKLGASSKPVSTEQLAQDVGEGVATVAAALEALVRRGSAVMPAAGRWLSDTRWGDAREQVLHAVREFAEKNPARYGVMKGELKSGLRQSLDAGLFDAAFASLAADGEIEQRGERVRPGGMPWEPPAAAVALLEKLESMLEADGFQVPENATWQKSLGAGATDAAGLGFFLGRLVRVNADLTFTAAQMARLESLLASWFAGGHSSLTVADFRGITGASRKFGVPLLEHCDRMGWTVRVGDERRRG